MPPRPTFRGFLRLSLVSVPVKGFTASVSSKEIRLNQLHKDCNQRIRYQKTCPEHGVVTDDEIVKGYEYTKDQYVIVDPEEVQKLRKESDKTVEIRGFVRQDQLDPMYFSGKSYFFLPDGPAGQKPYALLRDAMRKEGLCAVSSAILSGREQMVVVRPVDDLLAMTVLTYHEKLRRASDFADEVRSTKATKEEEALTKTLIDASRIEDFDFSAYSDHYVEQMTKLIEAKVEGQEIVAAPEPEEPKIINLMEALKQSVESARTGADSAKKPAAKKRAAKKAKLAPSTGAAAKRKRKTG
jgi:DNA end-binding protein Ku